MAVTRKEQAQQRREQFLQIALELFAQYGFEETSIKELALRAEVTEGLLYHYFRSKEELLFAVVERESFLPQLQQMLTLSQTSSAQQVLNEFAQSFALLLSQKRHVVRIILREAQTNPTIDRWFQQFTHQGVALMAHFLQSRIETGELRAHPTDVTARLLFSTLVMAQLMEPARPSFFAECVETIMKGIQQA
jgi:AcrR family transcriptional regulator